MAGCAFHADIAAHHFGEAPADREAESGAAEIARGARVGLHEGLEQTPLFVGGDADAGVAHREFQLFQFATLPERFDFQRDFAAGGELDRVGKQVVDDLGNAQAVAGVCRRNARIDAVFEQQTLARSEFGVDGGGARRQRLQRYRLGADFELAGFDFREIKNVVDEAQQRGSGIARDRKRFALLAVQVGEFHQLEHA